jgi:hypothetical protein
MTSGMYCDYRGHPCPPSGCDCAVPESLCDEHEWAGYGDCPKCLEQYPDEVAAMHRRLGSGDSNAGA